MRQRVRLHSQPLKEPRPAVAFEFLDVFGNADDGFLDHFLGFGLRRPALSATE